VLINEFFSLAVAIPASNPVWSNLFIPRNGLNYTSATSFRGTVQTTASIPPMMAVANESCVLKTRQCVASDSAAAASSYTHTADDMYFTVFQLSLTTAHGKQNYVTRWQPSQDDRECGTVSHSMETCTKRVAGDTRLLV
jgi:hypothetical protein